MRVDMQQRTLVEPGDMGSRHVGHAAAIGSQRRVTPLSQPHRHPGWVPQRLHHHGVVIALQRDQLPGGLNGRQQPLDDLFAGRTLVDVVAHRDDDPGLPARMRNDSGQRIAQEIVAAVDVRDDVGQAHGVAAFAAGSGG